MALDSEISTLTAFARSLAELSGKAILPHFRSPLAVQNKQDKDWDPVTEADKSAERAIRAAIEKAYPPTPSSAKNMARKKAPALIHGSLIPLMARGPL